MKYFSYLIILLNIIKIPCYACTGWGNINSNGDILIAKNRDFIPSNEYIEARRFKNSFSYLGLFALNKNKKLELKAGINEKNLVMTSLSASVLPSHMKKEGEKGVMSKILSHYSNIQEIYKNKNKLFSHVHPMFYMLADTNCIAYIEIAPNQKISFIIKEKGSLTHTNHYLDKDLTLYNIKKYPSSYIRYERINQLLSLKKDDFSIDDFQKYANDKLHNPQNSIWRTSVDENHERTVATWIVTLPHDGKSAYVYIKLAAPNANGIVVEGLFSDLISKYNKK